MLRILNDLVSRLIPPDALTSPHAERQARVVIAASLIIVGAGIAYSLIYFSLGMYIGMAGALCGGGGAAITALHFSRRGDPTISAHTLGGSVYIGLVGAIIGTGGLDSPGTAWMILCPVIPSMIAGRKHGVPWVGMVAAFFAFLYVGESMGWLQPQFLPSELLNRVNDVIVPLGLAIVFFGIAWSHEVAQEAAFARIEQIGDELRQSQASLEDAHASAQLLLDTVADGLLMVDGAGVIQPGHSRAVGEFLGPPQEGATLWDFLAPHVPGFAQWVELAWEDVLAGWMPFEVTFGQLPERFVAHGRHIQVGWVPLEGPEGLERVMLVLRDVTTAVEAAAANAAQEELLSFFQHVQRDVEGTLQFVEEARGLVRSVVERHGSVAQERRWIHTLKGNTAVFRLQGMADWLHELEDRFLARGELLDEERAALHQRWTELEGRVGPLFGQASSGAVTLEPVELLTLARRIEGSEPRAELAQEVRRWTWRSVASAMHRLAERVPAIAERLHKHHTRVEVEACDIRQRPSEEWSMFWASLIHVVRNAVDHGIDAPEERADAGKPPEAVVKLAAREEPRHLIVEISDDGHGVDWTAIADQARIQGLPHETKEDLVRCLFADGLTTREEATELSGRGVGMAAVWEAANRLDGQVDVVSEAGRGTTFRFAFPRS